MPIANLALPDDSPMEGVSSMTTMDLTNTENRVSNDTPTVLLTPVEVAERLNVCVKTAIRLMKELPHVSVSMDLYSSKQRLRITEQTLEDYKCGRIERKRLRRGR